MKVYELLEGKLFKPKKPKKPKKAFPDKESWVHNSKPGKPGSWSKIDHSVSKVKKIKAVKKVKAIKVSSPIYTQDTAPTGKAAKYRKSLKGSK